MYQDGNLWVARGTDGEKLCLDLSRANRHGLIAGATGTGKTVTLKVMAEGFSDAGVPVFLADVKGDLAGMAVPGTDSEDMRARVARFGIGDWTYRSYPTRFWDVFGEAGHSVRTTVSEMGPLLLARILGLNDTQAGVLNIAFRVADENSLLLLDIKDLKAMLKYISDNARDLSMEYGNIAAASVSAIVRALVALEDQGGGVFFGEPALDVRDWIQTAGDGRGWINVLHCVKLFQSPALYSTFLLWMLSELYEALPEAGDAAKPKVVFFFDEAHLLFEDAPKALLQKIEQVVRLVRSKGVGVYFVTQSPTDIPDDVLAQLGNRVQHALRAYSPAEQKKVRAAADTFRPNPAIDTAQAVMELATGEALVSFLQPDGSPAMVSRAFILPPQSRMGGIPDEERRAALSGDGIGARYDTPVDRESAYELLTARAEKASEDAAALAEQKAAEKTQAAEQKAADKAALAEQKAAERAKAQKTRKVERIAVSAAGSATRAVIGGTIRRPVTKNQSLGERALNSAFNTTVNSIGREVAGSLVRGLFGNLLK